MVTSSERPHPGNRRLFVVAGILWLVPVLVGCEDPATQTNAVVSSRTDGSTRALSARPAAPAVMTPALRAAYVLARQQNAGRRFSVTPGASGQLSGRNLPHSFSARFDAAGVRLTMLEDVGVTWAMELRLGRYGRQGALTEATGTPPTAQKNRVEREHHVANGATIKEWYLNGPLGLEQGFTLTSPPPGDASAPVELELEVAGDLHPRPGRDGRSAVLAGPAGEAVLAYRDLFVHDARGKELPAELDVRARRMTIRVDTSGAAFPVTIDPLITTETKLPPPVVDDLAKEDKFGTAVAINKDTAVVGAPEAEDKTPATGAAYVFVKQGSTWRVQARLLASDGAMWDYFGRAVAINGDTVVVGADSDDDKGLTSGAAYVFVRKGSAWSQQKKLVPSDGAAGDMFGASVAVSGDTVVVGAEKDDDKGAGSGSVYIYLRSGTAWSLQKKMVAADGGADDGFGRSVAADKDIVAVGAPRDDDKGGNAGAVYVYTRSGTAWSQQQKLTAKDGGGGDAFGWSLALEGSTLVSGAPWEETTVWESGAVYVFFRSGTTWSQQAKLVAKSFGVFDNLGISVSLSGDRVVAGVPKDDIKVADEGSAIVFSRSGTSWSFSSLVSASDGKPADLFGGAVAISGGTVLVGASKDDVFKNDEGSLYVYTLAGSAWTQQQKVLAAKPGGAAGDGLGSAVAINGDTAVVGSPHDDDKGKDSGSAHVFLRGKAGWVYQQMLTAKNAEAGDNFGHAVAVSGDTAVVGAPFDRASLISPPFGAVYIFVRSGTTWTQQQMFVGAMINEQFGFSVALHKDTMVAGAPFHSIKGTGSGAAAVYVRSGTKWTSQHKFLAPSAAAGDRFGYAVAVDGDTVVAGAPKDDDKGNDSGSAFIYSRSGTKWTLQKQLLAADAAAYDQFGTDVAVEGNTAVVGAPADDDKGSDSGSAYVFSRGGTTWTQQQKLVPADLKGGDHFGSASAVYKDTILVGAPGQATDSGAAYVFLRSGTKWKNEKKIISSDSAAKDAFGGAVAFSGDTAVVGASGNADPYVGQGAAYAYKVQRPAGVSCMSAGQCVSGHCVEGLCCDTACGGGKAGDCQACSVANGATTDGTCGPIKAGAPCRASSGGCDAPETCDGTNLVCPADTVRPTTHVCRAATGGCDLAESCDGSTKVCPADKLTAKDAVCRKTAGVCDTAEVCTGTAASCPADTFKTKGTLCRAEAAGGCDAAEACDGFSAQCPADAFKSKGTVCRKGNAPCDASETCDGATKGCPPDNISVKGAVCRKTAGGCDLAETCDGVATTCPADKLALKGVVCRKTAGTCDLAEACSGSTATCPVDQFKGKGTACRAASGDCDLAESCSGAAAACPTDSYKTKGTVCRKTAGDCDSAESCDGASGACPTDAHEAKGTVCRKAAGECDVAETCGGAAVTCPKDVFQPTGTKCLKGAGTCKAGKCDKAGDGGVDSTAAEAGADATSDRATSDKAASDKATPDKATPDKAAPDKGTDTDPEENGCSCVAGGGGGWSWGWALMLAAALWFRRRRQRPGNRKPAIRNGERDI